VTLRQRGTPAIALAAIAAATTAAVTAAGAAPVEPPDEDLPRFAVAGPAGFGLVSADGRSMLATHWVLETDFSSFLDAESPAPARDSFVLRFAGARLDAVLDRDFHAQLFVNFADNRVAVLEGWIEARLARWARLRIGIFPFPITQERVTPGLALPFVSTSVAAMLLPARDTGIQLLGQLGDAATYHLAVVNGAFAGSPGGSDGDSGKDVVARVFVRPLASTGIEPLRKLGVGVGASIGRHTGTPSNPQLPSLLSYGGQVYFSYRAMVTAAGRVERIAPHLTWGAGPFALYADAVWTREHIAGTTVDARAVSAIASVVVTGEAADPLGFVIPAHPFDPTAGQLGAFALVAGAGDLAVDSAVFPTLADPATAMRRFRVLGGGVNWYLSRGVAVLTSYGHQTFDAAPGGTPRRDEDTVIARLQLVL
jgi:hypothetical protein